MPARATLLAVGAAEHETEPQGADGDPGRRGGGENGGVGGLAQGGHGAEAGDARRAGSWAATNVTTRPAANPISTTPAR